MCDAIKAPLRLYTGFLRNQPFADYYLASEVDAERERWRELLTKMHKALKRFGKHENHCGYTFDTATQTGECIQDCTCGYEDAIKLAEEIDAEVGKSRTDGGELNA